jgi:hypothetical protein
MPAASTSPSDSVRARLESLSMRLDAATDNLLQTRDLLIRHLENQLLQLQEVRSALHEAAEESSRWAAETATPTPAPEPAPAIKPTAKLTLESLFAPLNASPRAAPPAPPAPPEEPAAPPPVINAEVIFEAEPATHWDTLASEPPASSAVALQPDTAVASVSHEIDPALEKATLDELNEALTRAFAQIANRHASS